MGGLENKQGRKAFVLWKIRYASGIEIIYSATFLVAGNSLEPFLPRWMRKHSAGQENNLGTVKMKWIGQSAGLLPTDSLRIYGRATETEREWVVSVNKPLKIQSCLLRNLKINQRLQQLSQLHSQCLIQYQYSTKTIFSKYQREDMKLPPL